MLSVGLEHAGFLVELRDFALGFLVALDHVTRLQLALEVVQGQSALLAFLDLGHILLELLHAVELQVVLQHLLAPHHSVFEFPLDVALCHPSACDLDHFRDLGAWVFDFEKLCDMGGPKDVYIS